MADSTTAALTALATIDGDELLYAVDDPAGTPLDRKVTTAQITSGLMSPNYMGISGVYMGPPVAATLSAAALTAGRLYTHPIFIPQNMTLTDIGVVITVAGAGNIRLGVYNSRSAGNALPGTLLLDAGTVSVNVTNTFQAITALTTSLKRGFYILAAVTDVAPTAMRISTNSNSTSYAITGSTAAGIGGAYRAFTYAALPADETAQTYSTGAAIAAMFIKGTLV